MHAAKARYTGNQRTHNRRVPSGETIHFARYPGHPDRDTLEWTVIDDPDTARYLDSQTGIEVEWTPTGRLQAAGGDAIESMRSMGYQAKQKLVGADGFGLDSVAGNASEDEMEQALAEHIRDIEDAGEL